MLDADRREKMKAAIDALPCHVVLPAEWGDFFQRRGPLAPREDETRRFVRQHFPTRALMELATSLVAIPREYAKYVVLMKDISRQGACFLHIAQLFPGERVELTLSTGRIPYTVMRCRRYNDCCYEVGADVA
jgi:hypothetical protein